MAGLMEEDRVQDETEESVVKLEQSMKKGETEIDSNSVLTQKHPDDEWESEASKIDSKSRLFRLKDQIEKLLEDTTAALNSKVRSLGDFPKIIRFLVNRRFMILRSNPVQYLSFLTYTACPILICYFISDTKLA
jgi:hypothetical protein